MKIMYCVYLCKYMLETLVSERQRNSILYGDSKSVIRWLLTVIMCNIHGWTPHTSSKFVRSVILFFCVERVYNALLWKTCTYNISFGPKILTFCDGPMVPVYGKIVSRVNRKVVSMFFFFWEVAQQKYKYNERTKKTYLSWMCVQK